MNKQWKCPISPTEMIKRMKDVPKIVAWSRNKHLKISGPEFWGIYHIFVDNRFKHAIIIPKADLTTHVFIGTPTEAQEYRKYDKDINLTNSKQTGKNDFEWKIYKDYFLIKGHGLPPKEIPEEPYWGKVIEDEPFDKEINDGWIVAQIREIYKK